MRSGRPALLAPLARLAGAEPRRVGALARALHREARGQRQWQHAQEGGGWFGPEFGRRLALGWAAIVSIGVALLVRQLGPYTWLAGALVCTAQFWLVFLTVVRDAVPLLLADEDRRVLGWWPVSERELLLARAGLLLRSVLLATAAIGTLPLLALAIPGGGSWPAAPGLAVGLLLHGLTLAALLAVILQGLARLLGPERARRSCELVGVLAFVVLTGIVARNLDTGTTSLAQSVANWRLALPPMWFGAWAALWPPAEPPLAAAALSVVVCAAVVAAGLRWVGAARRGVAAPAPAIRGRRGLDAARLVTGWLRPWFTGREGRVVLSLLRAHLRADWRFAGQLLSMPLLMLVMLWWHGDREMARLTAESSLPAAGGNLALLAGLLAILFATTLTFSSAADAGWLLRGGVAEGRRLLAMHRRVVRLLVSGPFLAAAAVLLALRAPTVAWPHLALELLLGLLAAELGLAVAQWLRPAAPFSRAWRRGEQAVGRSYFWLFILAWPLHELWLRNVLDRYQWGWLASLLALALAIAVMRRLLAHRVAVRGVLGMLPAP